MGNILLKYTYSLTLAFIDVMCGDIPFYIAAYYGHDKILWSLLAVEYFDQLMMAGGTPLLIASGLGNERVVEFLLNREHIQVDHAKHGAYKPLFFQL